MKKQRIDYIRLNRQLRDDTDEVDPYFKTGLWGQTGEEKREGWKPLVDQLETDDEWEDPFSVAAEMDDTPYEGYDREDEE